MQKLSSAKKSKNKLKNDWNFVRGRNLFLLKIDVGQGIFLFNLWPFSEILIKFSIFVNDEWQL